MNTKKQQKELKVYTPDDAKNIALGSTLSGDADAAIKHLAKLLTTGKHGTLAEQNKVKREVEEEVIKVLYGFESDSHVALMESFTERFRGGMKEICKQFIADFDCKTDSEKILAETAAIAFGRYLDASRRLNSCLDLNDASGNRVAYMAMISKERDRAHRQYLSTLSTLKQFKAPIIEMNIRTNNAFVSQNQQINVPQAPKENNEAK